MTVFGVTTEVSAIECPGLALLSSVAAAHFCRTLLQHASAAHTLFEFTQNQGDQKVRARRKRAAAVLDKSARSGHT